MESDSKASQHSRDVWQAAVENMERDNIIREKIGLIINKRSLLFWVLILVMWFETFIF